MPQYTETIRQWEDSTGISFYPVRQNQANSYLNINQPLPTDGYLYIRSGIQNFTDYFANDRNAQISSSIGLRQPIEALFGFNNIQLNFKQAKLNYEMTLKRLKRNELDLEYSVSQAFYALLSAKEQMNIAKLNLNRQQEAHDIAQNKYEAGLIREVEALQMEVDLSAARNNYDNAIVNFSAQHNLFKETLGIDLADSISIQSEMDYIPVIVDVEKAVDLALKNRLELKENEIQIELQEMNVKRQKAAGMVSGDVILNYNFIGVDKSHRDIPIGTTFDHTWQNLMDRPGSFGVGLTARIPILDWGENRARVKSARSVLKQNQLQMDGQKISIEREIRTLVAQLQNNLNGLEIMEKSVVVAEKSFEISSNRYADGEIDSQAMALERDRLNQTYLSRLSSYINYKLGLSDLMRKTFYDFEANREIITGGMIN
jgi:outer membrane protein TolC